MWYAEFMSNKDVLIINELPSFEVPKFRGTICYYCYSYACLSVYRFLLHKETISYCLNLSISRKNADCPCFVSLLWPKLQSVQQPFVNYKWFSQHKWLRFLLLMSICVPRWNFCNEIFYKRNILIKFFLGIYFLIQDNFHSNLNKRKFIPWESFCFSWMFWKLILQKRAWVNKTARMSVSWWWQMQTTHKIHR